MKQCIVFLHSKNAPLHEYEIEAFFNIYSKHNTLVFIYAESFSPQVLALENALKKKGVFMKTYTSIASLTASLKKLQEKISILYIDSFYEPLIQVYSELKKSLLLPYTEKYSLFLNKHEQRKRISGASLKAEPYFQTYSYDVLDFYSITQEIPIPFIIKPVSGNESIYTELIDSPEEFEKYKEKVPKNIHYLVEEYIPGNLYSIDYFVDAEKNIYFTPPIEEYTIQELGGNDFSVFCSQVYKNLEHIIDMTGLQKHIAKIIDVCDIKNSFIHHEFKFTEAGDFITIEINGKIGGRRLKILKEAYDIELYDLFFQKKIG